MSATVLQAKARPTNADLQDQIKEVHACVHAVAERVKEDRHAAAKAITKVHGELHKEAKESGERMARIEAAVEAISTTLGMKTNPDGAPEPVKRFGSQTPFTVVMQMFGACSGALLLIRTVGPTLQTCAALLWAALTHT